MSVPRWIVPAILSALCLALVLALCGPHDAQQKMRKTASSLPMILPLCSRWAFLAPVQSIFT